MTPHAPTVYVFGEFRLDPARHRFDRAGQPVTLPPKAFQLLVLLVQNAGAVVTKETLMDALWPDVIVQENNVTQQISLLRRMLGESDCIETVPRVGYRFTGEVLTPEAEPFAAPPASELESALPVAGGSPAGSKRRRLYAAAVLTLLFVALLVLIRRDSDAAEPDGPIRSIAVLPLRPLGPSGEVAYLGVGIADGVIHQLATERRIAVRPSSAVRKYAGSSERSTAAKDLNVDAIVDGTIQQSGDRIRIRVQIVDARSNLPIFSGKFDESAADLFAVEDVVAAAVARALALELPAGGFAEKRRSRAPGAYEAYLKGRFEWSKKTPAGVSASIAQYERALALDGSYAAAWAGLADSLTLLPMHRVATPNDAFPRAREAAQKALALDDTLPDAHVALGLTAFYYQWDWAQAEHHLRRAMALDPEYSGARHILANLLVATGRGEEGIAMMADAIRREPSSLTFPSVASFQFQMLRRYEDAARSARSVLDRDSSFAQGHVNLASSFLGAKRPEEGIASMERAAALLGRDTYAEAHVAIAYAHDPARHAEARAMEPRLQELLRLGRISPFDLARYHALLGNRHAAMQHLEQTIAMRDPGMVWLAVHPHLDGLRNEPRFREMLTAMNLQQPAR